LNKKIFSFTLDPENVEKLKEYLLKEGLTLSNFIDSFIEDFVLNQLPKIEKEKVKKQMNLENQIKKKEVENENHKAW
jgi:hypothetical protein